MTFGGGRKRQPWVGWGGQHPPGAQESALGCKNSSSIPRHSLGAFMCPEKMGIVVTLRCGAPVPWAALAPLAHAHDAPSLLCPTAPGTTQHPWPRTSPAPFSPTQPPAPTHSHGTVPIEGGHCGAQGRVSTRGRLSSLITTTTFAGHRLGAGAAWICLISVDGY